MLFVPANGPERAVCFFFPASAKLEIALTRTLAHAALSFLKKINSSTSGLLGLVLRVHGHLPRRGLPRHVHGLGRRAGAGQVPGEDEELLERERVD